MVTLGVRLKAEDFILLNAAVPKITLKVASFSNYRKFIIVPFNNNLSFPVNTTH